MKIYDKLGKEHKTVEEALAAEKEYDAKVAAEQKKKEELANTRKADAAKVDEAYKAMINAQKVYRETLQKFVKKHGSYHKTYSSEDNAAITDLFNLSNLFWF